MVHVKSIELYCCIQRINTPIMNYTIDPPIDPSRFQAIDNYRL